MFGLDQRAHAEVDALHRLTGVNPREVRNFRFGPEALTRGYGTLKDRIGPYTLITQLVSHEGLELWDAKDDEDRPFWVQTSVLDGEACSYATEDLPASEEESTISEGQKRQKAIAKRTAQTISYQEAPMVHAHGGLNEENGNRRLYWSMDKGSTLPLGAQGNTSILEEPIQWLAALRCLIQKLGDAHAENYTFGHLDLPWLILAPEAKVYDVAGLYIATDSGWLVGTPVSFHRSPEEEEEALSSGDFWRLGQCFAQLLRPEWPESFEGIIAELIAEDLSERECDPDTWKARLNDEEASLTRVPTDVVEIPNSTPLQSSTKDERPRDPTPASPVSEPGHELAQISPSETIDERARSAIPQAEISEDESSTGSSSLREGRSDLSEANTASAAFAGIEEPAAVDSGELTTPDTRLDPEAAAWVAPDLPAGASPWSEVVSANGTAKKHSPSDFPGFAEELPDQVEFDAPESKHVEDDSDPELDFVVSGFSAPKIALGALALFFIFGAFLLMLEPEEPEAPQQSHFWSVSQLNEVVLDSIPPRAYLIAEQDGSKLGQTPQSFLSPGDLFATVLLWAPGYEAQSVIVPDRGKLTVTLNPLPKDANCSLKLQSASNCQFESFGDNLGSPPDYTVNGTTIVRASRGEGMQGARLVRCPKLGGSSAQVLNFEPKGEPQTMRVTSSTQATLYLSGSKQGIIPREVRSDHAFVRLTAQTKKGSESWWVPVEEGVEIQLPEPETQPIEKAQDKTSRTKVTSKK